MNGKATTPVVMLGRYSTLAGALDFTTSPINVVAYDSIELHVWRGKMISGGSFSINLQESTDRVTWYGLGGGDPGSEQVATYTASPTRAWFRVKVTLGAGGSDFPVVSCYAVGDLVKRRD